MTNHLHALLKGRNADADLRAFVARFKQRTGFEWKRRTGRPLWQEGYFDRILREEDSDASVIAYIARNPVEAGLARNGEEYPLFGSSEHSRGEIANMLRQWEREQAIDRGWGVGSAAGD
jgi:hypothetical protein